MTIGLTYTRGRAVDYTTESGTLITRVAGQFAQHASCPIRGATPDRVRITVGSMFTSTSGAVVVFLDPDNANGGGGQQANGLIFCCRTDANNRIELEYTKGSTVLTARRLSGGAGATVTASLTFSAGDALCVYIAWDASNIYVAANGGAIASAANAVAPAIPTTCDIGSQDGSTASTFFNAAYAAVLFFSAPITTAQWVGLAALRALRPPLFGEWAQPTGLWYGAHSQVWSLPSTGQWFDFKNTTNVRFTALDVGVASPLHRTVETPLGDGAVYIDTKLQPRNVAVDMSILGTSIDGVFDLRRQIAAALNPRRGQGLLMFASYDTVYEVSAMLQALPYTTEFAQYVRTQAQFLCTDPAWRYGPRQESLATVPAGGWTIPWTIPWTITESAVSQNVTNSGDLEAYPLITITASSLGCVNPYAINSTTGKSFRFAGLTMAPGEVLVLDMDARTAILNGVTNVIGYRTFDSAIWALTQGVNSVKIGADSGSATVKLSFAPQLVGV